MKSEAHGPAEPEEWLQAEVTRRLFGRRHLLLSCPLDTARATRLAAELMTLEAEGPEPVTLSVNSTGGDLAVLTERLFDLLSRATRRPRHAIAHGWQHGRGLSAPEALADGLIDEIV